MSLGDHLLFVDVTYSLGACLWPGIYGSGMLDTTVCCSWLYCIYSGTYSRAASTSLWHVWIYLKIHLVTAYKHQSEVRNRMQENTHYITVLLCSISVCDNNAPALCVSVDVGDKLLHKWTVINWINTFIYFSNMQYLDWLKALQDRLNVVWYQFIFIWCFFVTVLLSVSEFLFFSSHILINLEHNT